MKDRLTLLVADSPVFLGVNEFHGQNPARVIEAHSERFNAPAPFLRKIAGEWKRVYCAPAPEASAAQMRFAHLSRNALWPEVWELLQAQNRQSVVPATFLDLLWVVHWCTRSTVQYKQMVALHLPMTPNRRGRPHSPGIERPPGSGRHSKRPNARYSTCWLPGDDHRRLTSDWHFLVQLPA